jgi:dephospho-CoA kinase
MIQTVPPTPPIIGITGGIGSGKSFVASLFAELGCFVISSDAQVRLAYDDPHIRRQLRDWWGSDIFKPDGSVDRKAIARLIFSDDQQRRRLENLLHPWIAQQRDEWMKSAAVDPKVKAIIWDTPLLHETGLDQKCDAVVFVDAPADIRFNRVRDTRGWDAAEIIRRENLQWPLDKKRSLAHYVVVNTADAASCRSQVREILSRILAN